MSTREGGSAARLAEDSVMLKIEMPFIKQRMTISFRTKNCLKLLKFIISDKLYPDFEQINFKVVYKYDRNKAVDLPLNVPVRYIDEFIKFEGKEHTIRMEMLHKVRPDVFR